MVVLQHEHLLSLIDVNPMYPHDEQVYDDEEDLIIKQAFQNPCNLCHTKITYLHRYHYKCDQCDYSLHKLCAKLPTQLEHVSHSAHTLTLFLAESQEHCRMCKSVPRYNHLCYHCSQCSFNICLDCSMDMVQYNRIYHPSHKHPLIPMYRHREILAECDACGKEHKGIFYHCPTCFLCFIHKECVFHPKRLSIQDDSCLPFVHTHPLILTYSFPQKEQKARFFPTCRVCEDSFHNYENLWVYKCDKCRYYVHLHCARLRRDRSKSGTGIPSKRYKDDPNVIHLPLPDRTCNIIKDIFLKETSEPVTTHDSHEHPLILVNTRCSDITTSMNKVEDLCNGCMSPIISDMPFYKCTYGCNFVLHDWCTRLPAKIKDHYGVRLFLLFFPKETLRFPGLFYCRRCCNLNNGFAYTGGELNDGYIDVSCALIPQKITHASHPYHILYKVSYRSSKNYCRMCLSDFTDKELTFSCDDCNFHLHVGCAMLLPTTIRHNYDKHPMTLTYSPVENHDGDYFCEVCEEELNPHISFYHCRDCVQSMHTACAPLIIPQNIIQKLYFSIYKKIKYGRVYKTKDHEHPLIFVEPAKFDGQYCNKCRKRFWAVDDVVKCLQCEFAIHYNCPSWSYY